MVKTQISQKSIKFFGMLLIMHAKDALWVSLIFKIFLRAKIVISRRYGVDKNVKNDKIH